MYGLCLTHTHSCNIKLYIQAAVASGFTHAFSPHISHVLHSCWLGLYRLHWNVFNSRSHCWQQFKSRVCDSTCDVWSQLCSHWILLRRREKYCARAISINNFSPERVDSKGLSGRWRLPAPVNSYHQKPYVTHKKTNNQNLRWSFLYCSTGDLNNSDNTQSDDSQPVGEEDSDDDEEEEKDTTDGKEKEEMQIADDSKDPSLKKKIIKGIVNRYSFLKTRSGRAGLVHNFLRGLQLTVPLSGT